MLDYFMFEEEQTHKGVLYLLWDIKKANLYVSI